MFIKSKVLATAATLTFVGALSTVGTVAASAATPQCSAVNHTCVEIFSAKYGTQTNLGFVETVFRGIPTRGVPTVVRPASSSNPAQDLIVPLAGTVSQLHADGMVSAAAAAHYGHDRAAQLEYAPYGKPTGLCAALAVKAYQNEGLSLQPCRIPGTTVWILDTGDSPATAPGTFPIVNASTTDFVHPFAMTILGNPAHQRFTPIIIRHLTGNPARVPANQLWGTHFGIVP
jgi:hypothetical protein